ncbi:hypothetical protein D5R93_11180 [Actinomyces lilanjuaniae]|uniref:Uncharacterized protein n=1 Tax=Actinomyces lilanjuaniae TaxID=2321394 RepID=A0ABN5PT71_9ACTO|nr:hypothetical protein [Actinomyces lilanjuaniae]AYD90424.1 hypothetical protein D5R93_11180 [Actinomyces lilanjuaniae]
MSSADPVPDPVPPAPESPGPATSDLTARSSRRAAGSPRARLGRLGPHLPTPAAYPDRVVSVASLAQPDGWPTGSWRASGCPP